MKSTGIVRKIDELGRVVLPKELRNTMNLPEGTPMEIFTEGDTIVLKKYQPGCVFCGGMDSMKEFGGQHICGKCVETIREALSD
jgi:transcriptional pleiotropic regulator of transition state genes